jgi:hypothetical protein
MKVLRSIIAATVLSLLSLCAFGKNTAVEHAARTTHHIAFRTIVEGRSCSATAIGPHALLTASHCELPAESIFIDNEEADIFGIVRDDNDHSIILVAKTFKFWSDVSATPASLGDHVFIVGNPGSQDGVYREGYVARLNKPTGFFGSGPTVSLYDLNGYHGDSGAALFNEKGEILGVLSFIDMQTNDKDNTSIKFMGAFAIGFTAEQLLGASDWKPEETPKPDK